MFLTDLNPARAFARVPCKSVSCTWSKDLRPFCLFHFLFFGTIESCGLKTEWQYIGNTIKGFANRFPLKIRLERGFPEGDISPLKLLHEREVLPFILCFCSCSSLVFAVFIRRSFWLDDKFGCGDFGRWRKRRRRRRSCCWLQSFPVRWICLKMNLLKDKDPTYTSLHIAPIRSLWRNVLIFVKYYRRTESVHRHTVINIRMFFSEDFLRDQFMWILKFPPMFFSTLRRNYSLVEFVQLLLLKHTDWPSFELKPDLILNWFQTRLSTFNNTWANFTAKSIAPGPRWFWSIPADLKSLWKNQDIFSIVLVIESK